MLSSSITGLIARAPITYRWYSEADEHSVQANSQVRTFDLPINPLSSESPDLGESKMGTHGCGCAAAPRICDEDSVVCRSNSVWTPTPAFFRAARRSLSLWAPT